jgi:hypothetical protein
LFEFQYQNQNLRTSFILIVSKLISEFIICGMNVQIYQKANGTGKSKESNLSKKPPCPGKNVPES